jgi:hypothetical protein
MPPIPHARTQRGFGRAVPAGRRTGRIVRTIAVVAIALAALVSVGASPDTR